MSSLIPNSMLERMTRWLPSSRPRLAMMPRRVATHFNDLLMFTVATLDHVGIPYIIHYGTLLGAARLDGSLPWDEDHDLFVFDVTREEIETKLRPIFEAHHFVTKWDPQGFLWVLERYWMAGSGYLSILFLPPLVEREEDLPVWPGGAPHLMHGELLPLQNLPMHGSTICAPAATETLLTRLYGESASPAVMARHTATPIDPEARAFWSRARAPGQPQDWPAISARFKARSRWRYHLAAPWWWFNGGYIIIINKLKAWARKTLEARRSKS